MKKSEAKVYKQILLGLRSRLRGDVNAMANAALKKNGVCPFTWQTLVAITSNRNLRFR
jgi:hypothetical protein